jgi:hypothetical protein
MFCFLLTCHVKQKVHKCWPALTITNYSFLMFCFWKSHHVRPRNHNCWSALKSYELFILSSFVSGSSCTCFGSGSVRYNQKVHIFLAGLKKWDLLVFLTVFFACPTHRLCSVCFDAFYVSRKLSELAYPDRHRQLSGSRLFQVYSSTVYERQNIPQLTAPFVACSLQTAGLRSASMFSFVVPPRPLPTIAVPATSQTRRRKKRRRGDCGDDPAGLVWLRFVSLTYLLFETIDGEGGLLQVPSAMGI